MVDNISFDSNDFQGTALSKVQCNGELSTDVYVKIGEKFIKFKRKGDVIPEEKYNYFISMNVRELFITKSEALVFEEAVLKIKKEEIEEIVGEVGEENRSIVEQQAEIRETVYETFLEGRFPLSLIPSKIKIQRRMSLPRSRA